MPDHAHKYTPIAVPVYGEEVNEAVAALQEGFVTPVGADTVVSYVFVFWSMETIDERRMETKKLYYFLVCILILYSYSLFLLFSHLMLSHI